VFVQHREGSLVQNRMRKAKEEQPVHKQLGFRCESYTKTTEVQSGAMLRVFHGLATLSVYRYKAYRQISGRGTIGVAIVVRGELYTQKTAWKGCHLVGGTSLAARREI
jgi:hypothetical protein